MMTPEEVKEFRAKFQGAYSNALLLSMNENPDAQFYQRIDSSEANYLRMMEVYGDIFAVTGVRVGYDPKLSDDQIVFYFGETLPSRNDAQNDKGDE